jgi:hypothetical protein
MPKIPNSKLKIPFKRNPITENTPVKKYMNGTNIHPRPLN